MTGHSPRDVGFFFDRATALFRALSHSPFINLGLWRANTRVIATAQRSLVMAFGAFCRLARRDRLLDVGCGTGAQDLLWMKAFGPAAIHGVNVSAGQVACARTGAARAGLSKRITYEEGDACRLRQSLRGFTRVAALECAHLFPDLPGFFRGARRALKPGGKLLIANLTCVDERAFSADVARGIVAALRATGIDLAESTALALLEEERRRSRLLGETMALAQKAGFSPGAVVDVSARVAPFAIPFLRRTQEMLGACTDAADGQALAAFAISFAGRQQQFANGSLRYLFIEWTR